MYCPFLYSSIIAERTPYLNHYPTFIALFSIPPQQNIPLGVDSYLIRSSGRGDVPHLRMNFNYNIFRRLSEPI